MVNYYKQFQGLKAEINTPVLSLDDFERHMIMFFGFGGRSKAVVRWVGNFEDAGLIKIVREGGGVWMVHIL